MELKTPSMKTGDGCRLETYYSSNTAQVALAVVFDPCFASPASGIVPKFNGLPVSLSPVISPNPGSNIPLMHDTIDEQRGGAEQNHPTDEKRDVHDDVFNIQLSRREKSDHKRKDRSYKSCT